MKMFKAARKGMAEPAGGHKHGRTDESVLRRKDGLPRHGTDTALGGLTGMVAWGDLMGMVGTAMFSNRQESS